MPFVIFGGAPGPEVRVSDLATIGCAFWLDIFLAVFEFLVGVISTTDKVVIDFERLLMKECLVKVALHDMFLVFGFGDPGFFPDRLLMNTMYVIFSIDISKKLQKFSTFFLELD